MIFDFRHFIRIIGGSSTTNIQGSIYMNVDQHLKVAQWHLEQARLHSANGDHKCGCPANDHDQKAIDAVEKGIIEEEKACNV